MSERSNDNMEVVLSSEQQALVERARSLVSGVKVGETTIMRPTTPREKASIALGRLLGSRPEPGSEETYHSTLRSHTLHRALVLRELQPEDFDSERVRDKDHLAYPGAGVISLEQRRTLTPPNTIRTEELSLCAIGRVRAARLRDDMSLSHVVDAAEELWRIDLLVPLDNETLIEVRTALERAVGLQSEA